MTRRVLALVAVALLAVSTLAFAGAAVAQEADTGEPYTYGELDEGGLEKTSGPSSQRWLSDYGSAVIRYTPTGPLNTEWTYLEQGDLIHPDEITLRTVRLAPEDELDRTLNVTIVAWEYGEREVVQGNQTVTRPAALNQTVHRQQVTLSRGYDNATLDLPDNLYRTAEMTVWIEEYPNARWRFKHHGLPTQESINIDSEGDALAYAGFNVLLPGLFGVILGLGAARATLRKTGTGPRLGLGIWAIAAVVLLVAIFSFAYFQLSVVLSIVPILTAAPLFVAAYGGGLWMSGPTTTVAFERMELYKARAGPEEFEVRGEGNNPEVVTDGGQELDQLDPEVLDELFAEDNTNGDSPSGTATQGKRANSPGSGLSEIHEIVYEDQVELPAKETEDGYIRVPKAGIRPFLARLFADPATLDKSNLMTKVEVDVGRIDEKIYVDPESDPVVIHEPASIKRRWPVLHKVGADATTVKRVAGILGMVGLVAGLPVAGYALGAEAGIPFIGAALGCIPAILDGYTGEDGDVWFDPAPLHFQRAHGTLIDHQREYADAKTIEEFRDMAYKERARTAKEAQAISEQQDRTLTEEMLSKRAGHNLVEPEGEAGLEVDDPEADDEDGGDGDE